MRVDQHLALSLLSPPHVNTYIHTPPAPLLSIKPSKEGCCPLFSRRIRTAAFPRLRMQRPQVAPADVSRCTTPRIVVEGAASPAPASPPYTQAACSLPSDPRAPGPSTPPPLPSPLLIPLTVVCNPRTFLLGAEHRRSVQSMGGVVRTLRAARLQARLAAWPVRLAVFAPRPTHPPNHRVHALSTHVADAKDISWGVNKLATGSSPQKASYYHAPAALPWPAAPDTASEPHRSHYKAVCVVVEDWTPEREAPRAKGCTARPYAVVLVLPGEPR